MVKGQALVIIPFIPRALFEQIGPFHLVGSGSDKCRVATNSSTSA